MLQSLTNVSFYEKKNDCVNKIFIKAENKLFLKMWKIDKCSLNCCSFFPCIVHIYQNQLNIYRNNVHHQIKFAPAKI